jgi:hypothetical protein
MKKLIHRQNFIRFEKLYGGKRHIRSGVTLERPTENGKYIHSIFFNESKSANGTVPQLRRDGLSSDN